MAQRAYIYLESPILQKLYEDLKFEVRTYQGEKYNLFEPFHGFLVRGIAVEKEHNVERNGQKYCFYTQRVGCSDIWIHNDDHKLGINISHIRGSEIGGGFRMRVKPFPVNRARAIFNGYSEGIIEYYNALKKHMDLKKKYEILLDRELNAV